MKINSLFILGCWTMIILWMIFQLEVFFELVVILFIMAMTVDNLDLSFAKRTKEVKK